MAVNWARQIIWPELITDSTEWNDIHRVCTLLQKQNFFELFQNISKTFPGLWLIFPGIRVSPSNLSFPRFHNHFSLQSICIYYIANSENFIARVKQIFRTCRVFFQDFPVLENIKIKFWDFPGFPGPVLRTLHMNLSSSKIIALKLLPTLDLCIEPPDKENWSLTMWMSC